MAASTSEDPLARLAERPIGVSCLIVAPHPDDETIGAGVALGRMRDVRVLHLTDGAPAERRFWTADCSTREEYAALRRAEALRALAHAGVPAEQVVACGCADQALARELPAVVRTLVAMVREHATRVIITTPYEGAHPDHDAAALACRMVVDLVPGPALVEMTSYHLHAGAIRSGRFLEDDAACIEVTPDDEELARKRRMLDAYVSQRGMLAYFAPGPERFRIAPRYDFARPPHDGTLFYETIRMPMSADEWRALAAAAIARIRGSGACAS